MMKRGYIWAGIIGAILILCYLITGVTAQPTHILMVNIATYGQDALYVCSGIFLVLIFLKGKQDQDAGRVPVKFDPDTPEDKVVLRRRQNLVFAFFILYGFIQSFQSWVLNSYTAGLTPIRSR